MIPPWSAYVPDRDRPDPHASPTRYEYLSRDEQEVRQALADWFQAVPVFSETRNVHTAESLLGAILSKLPLDEEGMDPELLRKGWMAAAGPFLSNGFFSFLIYGQDFPVILHSFPSCESDRKGDIEYFHHSIMVS